MTRLLPLLGAAVLALAACGTTEPAAVPAPAAAADEQIVLTDGRGEEVVLDGPAERTVGLEWGLVEQLVSLGVQPVGVADVEGYGAWVRSAPLTGEVTDVGVRGEPSVESVAALAPDLVLATTDLPEAAVAQLEAVAPVLVVRPADAADPIGHMRRTVELVARATGTQDAARTLLAEFDAALDGGRDAVAAAGLAGRPTAFSDAFLDGGQLSIRPFTGSSLAGAVAAEIGLPSAWTLEGDPDYGLATTDVEGLTALGDVEYVYYDNAAVTPDPVSEALAGNAVWDSLPFVRAGNVSRLPDGIWMFGGPASMRAFVEAVVPAVAG
jgi:iron complex transport system substrate-binding protein